MTIGSISNSTITEIIPFFNNNTTITENTNYLSWITGIVTGTKNYILAKVSDSINLIPNSIQSTNGVHLTASIAYGLQVSSLTGSPFLGVSAGLTCFAGNSKKSLSVFAVSLISQFKVGNGQQQTFEGFSALNSKVICPRWEEDISRDLSNWNVSSGPIPNLDIMNYPRICYISNYTTPDYAYYIPSYDRFWVDEISNTKQLDEKTIHNRLRFPVIMDDTNGKIEIKSLKYSQLLPNEFDGNVLFSSKQVLGECFISPCYHVELQMVEYLICSTEFDRKPVNCNEMKIAEENLTQKLFQYKVYIQTGLLKNNTNTGNMVSQIYWNDIIVPFSLKPLDEEVVTYQVQL